VYPRATAEKVLHHFAILEGVADRRARNELVDALLHQVNLHGVRRQKVGGFSGGMRQRLGVAIALLGNPKLIVVDEPTAGLDPAERVRFLDLLSAVGENAVVILSTHIVEDVAELCSRMAIIRDGTILLEAEPLAAMAALRGRIWQREVERDALDALGRDHAVVSTRMMSGRTIARVYAEAAPGTGFEPAEPTLGDVYFRTMGAAVA